MRILLSEGSGLTSRQVATRLDELGHEVEVLTSTAFCLARFTRHVRRLHRVPAFGDHPLAWLDAAAEVARRRRIDVLFPTQEQVAVLSAFPTRAHTIVPPFASLRRVQDKVAAARTLAELDLPQPRSLVVTREDELRAFDAFPAFVKRPISTASSGVRRVRSPEELLRLALELGLDRGLVVQAQADGELAMVQAVADHGRLVAWHANSRVREGVGGGASVKESLSLPEIGRHLETLTRTLRWHGAFRSTPSSATTASATSRQPAPRRAAQRVFAGVDLVAAMLALASGDHPRTQLAGAAGVRSHQLLLGLLAAARGPAPRRAVARELLAVVRGRDAYARSREELTPLREDFRASVPIVLAATSTLVRPATWRWFVVAPSRRTHSRPAAGTRSSRTRRASAIAVYRRNSRMHWPSHCRPIVGGSLNGPAARQ